jgi:hypothetical protein
MLREATVITLTRCMSEYGFTFANTMGEDVNFGPRPTWRLS